MVRFGWVGCPHWRLIFGRLFSSHVGILQFCAGFCNAFVHVHDRRSRFPWFDTQRLRLLVLHCYKLPLPSIFSFEWSQVTMKMPVFLSTLWANRKIGCMDPETLQWPAYQRTQDFKWSRWPTQQPFASALYKVKVRNSEIIDLPRSDAQQKTDF